MPQGSAADEHDSRESSKPAGVRTERNRRYDNNECYMCGKQGHKERDCPQSQQGKAGKYVHVKSHGQTPIPQQQFTTGLPRHTLGKTTGMAPASEAPRASEYKTASKAVVTQTEPAVREASTQNDDDYMYIRMPREDMALVDNGLTKTVHHLVSSSVGLQNAATVLPSVPVQLSAPASPYSCDDSSNILYARVSVVQPG